MGQYTKEMHEAYRKEQDEKAAKEAQERDHRRQRMARGCVLRAFSPAPDGKRLLVYRPDKGNDKDCGDQH
jgi:hypothetical protein